MSNAELKEMRKNITAIIDDIKYQSDSLSDLERLPVIQLKVILAKINKLTEKTTILLHYIEKQGKLSDMEHGGMKAVGSQPESEIAGNKKDSNGPIKRPDVQEKLKKIKVTDLQAAIGINEKYLFASELFKGNTDLFSSAIKMINQMTDISELKAYLDQLKQDHKWDSENETVLGFIALVERKFDQL